MSDDDAGFGPLVYVVVYLVALSVHAWVAASPPYGDEAFHYAAATRLWQPGSNAHVFVSEETLNFNLLFWQRPVFFLLLAPAAAVSFDAFREVHAVLVSVLPVVIVGLARQVGASRIFAGLVGLAAAVHPSLVVWTTRVFPDGLAATLALLSLLLWSRGRHLPALATALAAAWTKETAGLVLLVLAVLWIFPVAARLLRLAQDPRPVKPRWAPPVALSIAPLPLAYSLFLGARFPGWVAEGDASTLPNVLLGSALLLGFVFAAFAFRRARLVAGLTMGYLVFFAWYAIIYNHQVQGWYVAIPLSLALVAAAGAAQGLDERVRPRIRWRPFAAVLLVLLFSVAFLPSESASRSIAEGGLPGGPASFGRTAAYVRAENTDLAAAAAAFDDTEEQRVVAIDTTWLYVYYPFGYGRERVDFARSDFFLVWNGSWQPVIEAIEAPGTVTVIGADGYVPEVGLLLRDTYRECAIFENPSYQLVIGADCKGAGAAFLARFP